LIREAFEPDIRIDGIHSQSPRHSSALRCNSNEVMKCTDLGIASVLLPIQFPLHGGLRRLRKLLHEILNLFVEHLAEASRIISSRLFMATE